MYHEMLNKLRMKRNSLFYLYEVDKAVCMLQLMVPPSDLIFAGPLVTPKGVTIVPLAGNNFYFGSPVFYVLESHSQ
jgi:hypothetical protein